MAIMSRFTKSVDPKSYISLMVRYTNIRGFRSNFLHCESFLETYLPDKLALCETNLEDTVDCNSLIVKDYLPVIRKDSSIHMFL